jgi:hypothetical protein
MDGILLPHPQIFVPWMDMCDRLILPETYESYTKFLKFLGVTILDPVDFVYQHALPSISRHRITGKDVSSYTAFLSILLRVLPAIPIEWPVALDGNLRFRRIDELYNHRDELLQAAFRGSQNERFLHSTLRKYWEWASSDSGLRMEITPHEYVAAAKQIQIRGLLECNWKENLGDNQLHSDAAIVYKHLSSLWDCLRRNSDLTDKLLKLYFVPTIRDFRKDGGYFPRFRLARMKALSNRRLFNCFQDLVLFEYADICWSQVYFLHPDIYQRWF